MSLDPDAASSAAASVRVGEWEVAPKAKDRVEAPRFGRPLFAEASSLAKKAAEARLASEEETASRFFREATGLALQGRDRTSASSADLTLLAARCALDCGETDLARRLCDEQMDQADPDEAAAWAQIADTSAWPDAWLVAAVRRDPPDNAALDALAARYWKALFARCQLLTTNREAAADLAQDTWCRVLRGRERLRPGGNFRAYLLMIATNLWRDSRRAALRAGTLADGRLISLDGELAAGDGPEVTLLEILPDLMQMEAAELERLKGDVDRALDRLEPLWRDMLVSRFLDGESCAEIGRRYGRTEQTASGWVRRALSEMKLCFEDLRRGAH